MSAQRRHHRVHVEQAPTGDLRVTDAERERVVEQLRIHSSLGRLDVGELDERAEAALAARTGRDLGALTQDLPRPPRDRAPEWRAELRSYLGVMALLVAIWLLTGAGFPWPLFPALGWGVPLVLARPRSRAALPGGDGAPRVLRA